ncbi:uncharacterized protein LOC135972331 [Chrysemys picta bellii]|uniref:uncharacterized protein LOC135972331 n=1 Tax=Chrysemys picta bellii TaxID=8478 RepID=UPI0032B100B7
MSSYELDVGDIDEDFRQCLREYVTSVVHAAGTHVRTDRAGQVLTGAQLAARIKAVFRYWKTQRYDFSSPMKMAEAFAVMRQELNRRAVEATRREYDQFVQELDRDHQSTSSCLRVKPLEMQRRLEGKRQELLERCWGELRGEDPQKQAALGELKKELDKQMAEFLPRYEQRFKVKKGGLKAQIPVRQFSVHSHPRSTRHWPIALGGQEGAPQRGHQWGTSGGVTAASRVLEELGEGGEWGKGGSQFRGDPIPTPTLFPLPPQMTEMAEMREKANRGAVEAARREYGLFVKQLARGHQSMSSCLRVKPLEMKRRQEGKRQELLKRCRGELRGEDPQKQVGLEELKQELDKQMDQFLSAYGQRFKVKKAEWLGLYIGPSPAASTCRARARPHWPVHLPISKRLRPIGCPFRRWDGGSKGFWDL